MQKTTLLAILAAGMLLLPTLSMAQTASGTLGVTATVQSSISMVFNSNAGGLALSAGAGTNSATMALGNISAYGVLAGGLSRSVGAINFTISTPFDVEVEKYNGASANYSLVATLANPDGTNGWALTGTAVTNGANANLGTNAYGSTAYTLQLTVPFASAAGAISNTINFTAAAN